jgi:hypothetical protein
MKGFTYFLLLLILFLSFTFLSCGVNKSTGPDDNNGDILIMADQNCTDFTGIPREWLERAKDTLHIAYGHTSHGSQITSGMAGLVEFINDGGLGLEFPENFFAYNNGGRGGALDLRDTPFEGAADLGNPDRKAWSTATRNYLAEHEEINVIIWSWCGQVSSATASDIALYLSRMDSLENEYPEVKFVYMTGHTDGSGLEGNLHIRNEQIRTYCRNNNKVLYDFAEIESYDPDGNYFGDKYVNDNCVYHSEGSEGNWAIEWQDAHTEGVDWYECESAHSQALNANRKAYAAWWLWARFAGWSGE